MDLDMDSLFFDTVIRYYISHWFKESHFRRTKVIYNFYNIRKLSNSFKFKLPLYLCVLCDWFNLFYTLEWMKNGLDMNYFQVLNIFTSYLHLYL